MAYTAIPAASGGGGGSVNSVTGGTNVTITGTASDPVVNAATGAPSTATYITQTADGGLSAEQALGALASGPLYSTTTTGVVTALTTLTGLTSTSSALTVNLSTGVAGGQTGIGGTGSGEGITWSTTSNATKGSFTIGSSTGLVYDEQNKRLGVGETAASGITLSVNGVVQFGPHATGQPLQFRFIDNNAAFAQSIAYPGGGTNVTMNYAISPKGSGGVNFQLFSTDYVADATNISYLSFNPSSSGIAQIVSVASGSGTAKPLNLAAGGGGATRGLNLSTTTNNLSVNSNYVAFARDTTAVTAQSSGAVMDFSTVSPTQATGASIRWDAYRWTSTTTTLTGSTNVTTAAGFNYIDIEAQTITDSSAVTITTAATMTIKAAPTAGGSVTITNAYAFWIQAGTARLDGLLDHGSAGTIQLGTATLSANATTATLLGSLGPAGANTTVQEWMKVKGTGGADRYIPMF